MELFEYIKLMELFTDSPNHDLICCHKRYKCATPVMRGRPTSHLVYLGILLSARAELTQLLHTIDTKAQTSWYRLRMDLQQFRSSSFTTAIFVVNATHEPQTFNLSESTIFCNGEGSCAAEGREPSWPPSDDRNEYVYLQTWAPTDNPQCWIVAHNGITTRPAGGQPAQDHLDSVWKREAERSRKRTCSDMLMLCFAEQSP
ncbi:hypothetical protein GGI35DRAFT_449702 [Trichoderma velutinum]